MAIVKVLAGDFQIKDGVSVDAGFSLINPSGKAEFFLFTDIEKFEIVGEIVGEVAGIVVAVGVWPRHERVALHRNVHGCWHSLVR